MRVKSYILKLTALTIGITLSVLIAQLALNYYEIPLVSEDIEQEERKDYKYQNISISENLSKSGLYNTKLDSFILLRVNNFGFRGPDLPEKDDSLYKIIAVGGSTTICRYLSDGYDWPNIVYKKLYATDSSIWMNNAGLEGHSTFGHLQTLPHFILPHKPNMILFLVGCNDVERDLPNYSFDTTAPVHTLSWWPKPLYSSFFYKTIKPYRLLVNAIYNYRRNKAVHNNHVTHQNIDFKKCGIIETDSIFKQRQIETQLTRYIPAYKKRLLSLIKLCKSHKVVPVFVTQPSVLGNAIDPVTGVNLGRILFSDDVNGDVYFSKLQVYNTALKQVCNENNCHCIDLASAMPKNTLYYYDFVHFTNAGSALVADIIATDLAAIIDKERHSTLQLRNHLQ